MSPALTKPRIMYGAGGKPLKVGKNFVARVKRESSVTHRLRYRGVKTTASPNNDYCFAILTEAGTLDPIKAHFDTASEAQKFKRSLKTNSALEVHYQRGVDARRSRVPKSLPSHFCSFFSPAQILRPPKCAWSLLHWYGEQNAKRLGDFRFKDPHFIANLERLTPPAPDDDENARLELDRKWEEIKHLRPSRRRGGVPTYGLGAPLGMALAQYYRIQTPLNPKFGQPHLVFQSWLLLLLLDAESVSIIGQIYQRFRNDASRMVGPLSADEFKGIYRAVRQTQRCAQNEELVFAWHESQHGAVPLLIEYFDADLLLSMLSHEARLFLHKEAKAWQRQVQATLTNVTNSTGKARSIFEENPNVSGGLLDLLEAHFRGKPIEDWESPDLRRFTRQELPEIRRLLKNLPQPHKEKIQSVLDEFIAKAPDLKGYYDDGTTKPGDRVALAKRLSRPLYDSIYNQEVLDSYPNLMEKAIKDYASEEGATIHRHCLENARGMMQAGLSPQAIVAEPVERILAHVSFRFRSLLRQQPPVAAYFEERKKKRASSSTKPLKRKRGRKPKIGSKRPKPQKAYLTPARIAELIKLLKASSGQPQRRLRGLLIEANRFPPPGARSAAKQRAYQSNRKAISRLMSLLKRQGRRRDSEEESDDVPAEPDYRPDWSWSGLT